MLANVFRIVAALFKVARKLLSNDSHAAVELGFASAWLVRGDDKDMGTSSLVETDVGPPAQRVSSFGMESRAEIISNVGDGAAGLVIVISSNRTRA